jgi:hypothetical protein
METNNKILARLYLKTNLKSYYPGDRVIGLKWN